MYANAVNVWAPIFVAMMSLYMGTEVWFSIDFWSTELANSVISYLAAIRGFILTSLITFLSNF